MSPDGATLLRRPRLVGGLLRRHPLFASILAVVVLVAIAALGVVVAMAIKERTTVTIVAPKGTRTGDLERMVAVIQHRLVVAQFGGPQVVVDDSGRIKATVDGTFTDADLGWLADPGQVRFRKVLNRTPSPPPGPAGQPSAAPVPDRRAVLAKLGPAGTLAAGLAGPADGAAHAADLAAFATLSPAEAAALPATMQFTVPQLTCGVLAGRPRGSVGDVTQRAVACDAGGTTKYLLDVAKVVGADIGSAKAGESDGRWLVSVDFNAAGAQRWTALTREASTNEGGACLAPQRVGGEVCQVAIVLDDTIVTAPAIADVIRGETQLTGTFDRGGATRLAALLAGGELPFGLSVRSVEPS